MSWNLLKTKHFINSQQAFVDELFAKQATITKIKNVDFTGNHIKGGQITSLNGNKEGQNEHTR